MYMCMVPSVHGVHTQVGTLDELRENLWEVLALCPEALGEEVGSDLRWTGASHTGRLSLRALLRAGT